MLKTEMTKSEVYKELEDKFDLDVPKFTHIFQPAGIMGEVYCAWENGKELTFKIKNKNGEFILVD